MRHFGLRSWRGVGAIGLFFAEGLFAVFEVELFAGDLTVGGVVGDALEGEEWGGGVVVAGGLFAGGLLNEVVGDGRVRQGFAVLDGEVFRDGESDAGIAGQAKGVPPAVVIS